MLKINIFSVFSFNFFRRFSKKYLSFFFITLAILVYGFLFTNKIHAEEEIVIPTEVPVVIITEEVVAPTEVPEVPIIITTEEAVTNDINNEAPVTEVQENNVVLDNVVLSPESSLPVQDFLDITVSSDSPVEISKEILPGSSILYIPAVDKDEISIMFNNLPDEDLYFYIDSLEESLPYSPNTERSMTFSLGGKEPHLIFIKSQHSTKTIRNDATGGDCSSFGTWDQTTLTCVMIEDVFEVIDIVDDGITLDGNGHMVKWSNGMGIGSGINISFRRNITVENLIVEGFDHGFGVFQTIDSVFLNNETRGFGIGFYLSFNDSYNIIDGNLITNESGYLSGVDIASPGMYLGGVKGTTIINNTISVTYTGIGLVSSAKNNYIYNNNFLSTPAISSRYNSNNYIYRPMPVGGNYYRSYNTPKKGCDDVNNDFICDNPISFGNVTDNSPWVYKNGWKGERVLDDKCTTNCFPNVLFIPGFQASRLYKETGDSEDGTGYEKKLWEPGLLSSVSEMYMDENGESIDKSIYTKDVISRATLLGLGVLDFYKSFFEQLDGMVASGEISEWKSIAYDWRLSPLDIVKRGIEKEDGGISYTEELTAGQIPYIIGQLQKLVDNSNNGKVTIVTHSNGGLVAKALIAKLIEMKASGESDLIDKIDNLVAVAPPLLGTPKAMSGVLHGYDQGMFMNMLLTRKNARDFGLTLSGAYGLLPSEKYLSDVNNDLILLDPSLNKINDWINKYGESVDTYDELENFLLDIDKLRVEPSHDDLVDPTILNKNILEKAKLLHDTIDDLVIPSSIKVHQVAGWGLPTADDIRYKSKNECVLFIGICLKKKVVLSVDAGFTSGGDSTVVGGSALFGDGEEYYLDLEEYNKNNSNSSDHANIFEVTYLFDLIHNILKSDSSLPNYITKTEPFPIDYTVLKMRSPVAIDIYNEDGFHTGVVEGTDGASDTVEESIPNSLYMEIGDNKYIVVPKEGNYKLELAGLSDGIFTLEQEQLVNNLPGESVVWRDIPTTALFLGEVAIEGGRLATSIAMDENGDGEFESNLSPVDNSLEEEKEDDIIKRHIISGSYMVINNNTSSKNIVPDLWDTEMPTIIEEIKDKSLNNKVISKMIAIKTTKEIVAPEAEGNTLTASANIVYRQNPIRLKWQLIIVGSFLLLLGGLKFIFKLI